MSRKKSRFKRLSDLVIQLLLTYEERLVIAISIGLFDMFLNKGKYGLFIGESLIGNIYEFKRLAGGKTEILTKFNRYTVYE
jgi:hypothetical protein